MENRLASSVSLAKTVLMGLDKTKETTVISTATLDLLCRSLIEAGVQDNPTARAIQSAHSSFLQSKITGVEGR